MNRTALSFYVLSPSCSHNRLLTPCPKGPDRLQQLNCWGKNRDSSMFSSIGFRAVSMAGHFSCPSGARWKVVSLGTKLPWLTWRGGWSCGIRGLRQVYFHTQGGEQCLREFNPAAALTGGNNSVSSSSVFNHSGSQVLGESSQITPGSFVVGL